MSWIILLYLGKFVPHNKKMQFVPLVLNIQYRVSANSGFYGPPIVIE